MQSLHLPRMIGVHPCGWLSGIGLARVLSAGWPGLRVRWDQTYGHLVLTGGPATVDEAADTVREMSLDQVSPGGLLPGVDDSFPPRAARRGPNLAEAWTGPDAIMWQHALVSQDGLLHPMIAPHAAQTLGRMLGKIVAALRRQPELVAEALSGLGMSDGYGAGLWILRDDDRPAASPGRDWLALMAAPWMPIVSHGDQPAAVGWRITDRSTWPELSWSLWVDDIPAVDIPARLLVADDDPEPQYAWTRRRHRRQDPPMLRPVAAAARRGPGRPSVGGDAGAKHLTVLVPARLLADIDSLVAAQAEGEGQDPVTRSDVVRALLESAVVEALAAPAIT